MIWPVDDRWEWFSRGVSSGGALSGCDFTAGVNWTVICPGVISLPLGWFVLWVTVPPRRVRSILALEKLGAVFNQVATPLQYTPRKFVIHTESNHLVVIETDHNAYTDETKQMRRQQMAEVRGGVWGGGGGGWSVAL